MIRRVIVEEVWGGLGKEGSWPHPRKSFTSSTVTSPVVSSVVSPLVAESMDMGESVASGGSGVSIGRKCSAPARTPQHLPHLVGCGTDRHTSTPLCPLPVLMLSDASSGAFPCA
jgi:hypothetical protein